MVYYMVPKAMDQKPLYRKHKYDNFCIAGELLTEKSWPGMTTLTG